MRFSNSAIARRAICGVMLAAGLTTWAQPGRAGAAVWDVEVGNEAWTLELSYTSYADDQVLLESQPWWGDAAHAAAFAEAIWDNYEVWGLWFAYEGSTSDNALGYLEADDNGDIEYTGGADEPMSDPGMSDFVVGTFTGYLAPVPLPAGGVLLLSGLAGLAGLRRRVARRGAA